MNSLSKSLQFFLLLTKMENKMERKFDSVLGGLSIHEFMILVYLLEAPEKRMKRIDLAKITGLTPAGLTKVTIPLERLGLISREEIKRDARLSNVVLEIGGERKLAGAIERAEKFVSGIFATESRESIDTAFRSIEKIDSIL